MSGFFIGILPFLVIISVIVTVHELGHYWVARLFGTRIERFSVGFGSILISRKDRHGTDWCISALPLGGYVKFAGDDNISSMSPSGEELEAARAAITAREGADAVKDYFHFKPLWQRFLIILAGPATNFILAILALGLAFQIAGDNYTQPVVGQVVADSPAEAGGFKAGDRILVVDGRHVRSFEEIQEVVMLRASSAVTFTVGRNGQDVSLTATPARKMLVDDDGRPTMSGGQLGLRSAGTREHHAINPAEALGLGYRETWWALDSNLTYIGRMFSGKEKSDQISGVLGMTKATGDQTERAVQEPGPLWVIIIDLFLRYIQLMAVISIGVGFFNLLPVPALDGGHLAFYVWQAVTRQPVSVGFQNVAFRVAAVLILGLVLFAAWNDIQHIGAEIDFSSMAKFVKGVFS